MAARGIFPDTTWLCNFAAVHRLDLLRDFLRGRGRWTSAVAFEVARSSHWLPDLGGIEEGGWLDDPIDVEDDRVELVRRHHFGGSASKPLQHLGEAETCILITEHEQYRDSWWISEDADAVEYAQGRGITTYRTIDIMRMIVADGDLTAQAAFALMTDMYHSNRELELPSSPTDLE